MFRWRTSCIFMCNHVSNLDPPVLLPLLPGRSSVLLKKELMRIPILGTGDADGEVRSGGARAEAGGGEGQCCGGRGCAAIGTAYSGVSGGDSLAGWAACDVQEGAVLPGAGDAGSDCSGGDFRDADG